MDYKGSDGRWHYVYAVRNNQTGNKDVKNPSWTRESSKGKVQLLPTKKAFDDMRRSASGSAAANRRKAGL